MDGLAGLGDAWKEAAKDSVFRAVQDQVVDELYFKPAIKWWKSLGARTPLGLLILYDTAIQHGDGDDPDGLRAIIERTKAKAGGTPKTGVGEAKWFDVFLNVRRETLANAHDMETRAAWAAAVQRCDVLRAIANEGNYDLHGPITFKPHRMNFTIE